MRKEGSWSWIEEWGWGWVCEVCEVCEDGCEELRAGGADGGAGKDDAVDVGEEE
jgi:hypothetical protein